MAHTPAKIDKGKASLTSFDRENALFKFIKRSFESSPHRYSSRFESRELYCVTDKDIREIVARIVVKMGELVDEPVEFSFVVQTYERTEKKYTDIDTLLDRAGNLERISSIEINASVFTLLENGDAIAGKIELGLRENDHEFSDFDANCRTTFEIASSDEVWVRDSEQEFRAFLKKYELSIIEKQLRKYVQNFKPHILLALAISVLAYVLVLDYFELANLANREVERLAAQKEVLAKPEVAEMLRAFIELQFNPISPSFWWSLVVIALVIPAGFSAYFLSVWLGKALKAIVPNPIIAIGDSGAVALRDREGWKQLAAIFALPLISGLFLGILFLILGTLVE